MHIRRTATLISVLSSLSVVLLTGCASVQEETASKRQNPQETIVKIEKKYDSAIGVSLRDESGKVLLEWRSRERFPMTSTVKALACARVYELGLENQSAPIGTVKPVTHSPVYGSAKPSMPLSLKQACRAALSTRDNRAANFVFKLTGGPKALTAWLREKDDTTTRIDRIEPDLNLSGKNDYRDTTTPSNATLNWQRLDTQLPTQAHNQWLADLAANQVAAHLFRANLPQGWILYDRTGAGSDDFSATRAIHAILVNPKGQRYYAALHIKAAPGTSLEQRDHVLKQVIHIIYNTIDIVS